MAKKVKIEIDELIDRIHEHQSSEIVTLKIQAEHLERLGAELQSKIDRDGIHGYYSVHHDSFAVAYRVHSISARLGELKAIEEWIKSIKKETPRKRK